MATQQQHSPEKQSGRRNRRNNISTNMFPCIVVVHIKKGSARSIVIEVMLKSGLSVE